MTTNKLNKRKLNRNNEDFTEGNNPQDVQRRLQEFFSDDVDLRQGSLVGDLTRGNAEEFAYAYVLMTEVLRNSFLHKDLPSDLLTMKAAEYGIYRKESTPALATVTFTGDFGGLIPEGMRVRTSIEPFVYYRTTKSVEKEEGEDVSVNVVCEEGGSIGNVAAGRIDTVVGNLSGVLDVTNKEEAYDGFDEEDDETLYERVILKLHQPVTSGNVYHYEKWVTDVEGIRKVQVYPLWNGNGTVKVVLLASDGKAPTDEKIEEVYEYIESVRPIGADVTVEGAKEVPIDIYIELELREGYDIKVVEKEYAALADMIFRDTAFKTDIVRYSRMASLALDMDGVIDWQGLTVNGGTANIELQDGEIAVLGEVTVVEIRD